MAESGRYPGARALLDRYGLSAKKSWGQNFLVNDGVFRAIATAAVASEDDWVIEIGAGIGTLTRRLADRVPDGRVVAVERDRDMVGVLQGELGDNPRVTIAEADAVAYDYAALAHERGAPVSVCGNLPYHLSSPILFRLLDQRASIRTAVVMLQKEVADRVAAAPGSKAYGTVSAIVGAYADVRSVCRVSPGSFLPPPRVDSAVIAIEFLPAPRADIPNHDRYKAAVHAAFGQRRKQLRNALRARFDRDLVDRALAAAGIDGGRRGETLSIPEFAALARSLDAGAEA